MIFILSVRTCSTSVRYQDVPCKISEFGTRRDVFLCILGLLCLISHSFPCFHLLLLLHKLKEDTHNFPPTLSTILLILSPNKQHTSCSIPYLMFATTVTLPVQPRSQRNCLWLSFAGFGLAYFYIHSAHRGENPYSHNAPYQQHITSFLPFLDT